MPYVLFARAVLTSSICLTLRLTLELFTQKGVFLATAGTLQESIMGYHTTEHLRFHRQSFCVIIIFHNIDKLFTSCLSITPFPITIPVTNVSKIDLVVPTKEQKTRRNTEN